MSKGRLPDYAVHAMNKATDEKARVGGAWKNEDGSIFVKLDNFVQLIGSNNLVITLFVNDRRSKATIEGSADDGPTPASPF